jgi:hypothetical protein
VPSPSFQGPSNSPLGQLGLSAPIILAGGSPNGPQATALCAVAQPDMTTDMAMATATISAAHDVSLTAAGKDMRALQHDHSAAEYDQQAAGQRFVIGRVAEKCQGDDL